MMMFPCKRFCEKISNIVCRQNLLENDEVGLDQLTKIMVANVDMFYLPMILCSLRKSYCPLTIALYHPWLRHSVCKSGFKTGKRLQLNQTGPEKRPDCSLGLWYLKIKDCKKTGLFGPV